MKKLLIFLAALSALIAGCGGGGSGGGGSTNDVSLTSFVTDDLNTNYYGVWVNVLSVQMRKSDDSLVTVFSDPAGRSINLRALNDGAAKYALFGTDGIQSGSYSGLRVTLDRDVTLFPNGSTTGQARVFDDAYGTSTTVLDLLFSAPKTFASGSTPNMIIDFDLAQWEDIGGEVRNAVIREGNGANFNDPARHVGEDFKGTISGLTGTAPNFEFTLTGAAGASIRIQTTSSTSVFNNNGSPNPTLSNGKIVEVRGAFTPATALLIATSIKIKNSSDNDEFEVKGPWQAVNQAGRTFQIQTHETRGFIPSANFVNISVTDSTVFFTDRGVVISEADFFARLLLDSSSFGVEAEGSSYNATTNTLVARKCKLDDELGDDDAEARGAPSAINAGAGTFTITLNEWSGFSATLGGTVNVTTNSGTEYRNADGQKISQSAYFELLATAANAKVEGTYNNGTIVARHARIRSSSGGGGGGGGNDPHEAHGTPSVVNQSTRTFKLSLLSWFGFSGSAGQLINVTMNSTATYRDDEGESMTETAFFAALASGHICEVEGTYNSSTQTLVGVKAKLDDD